MSSYLGTTNKISTLWTLLTVSILFVFIISGISASAQSNESIAQSFVANGDLTAGSLASLKSGTAESVEPANTTNGSQIVGVVADDPLVTFTNDETTLKVVVSGLTHTLVSNINGEINSGDKITASPIAGIGMKTTEPSMIVGTAQADLESVKLKEHKVTDKDGQSSTVSIGHIPLLVHVTYYAETAKEKNFVPSFVQEVANTVAGKPVTQVRVVTGAMVLVLATISISVLLFTSVRSSIISIGRNPLSEDAIHKSLIEVGVMILVVLLLTSGTIYLILVT